MNKSFRMYPQLLILIIALIGATIDGWKGLLVGLILGLVLAPLIGLIFFLKDRGFIPRKVRRETAQDFIKLNLNLISKVYPSNNQDENQKRIEAILELMAKQANIDVPTTQLDRIYDPIIFMPAARKVINEQLNEPENKIASNLLEFLITHKHWYGNNE